MSNTYTKIELLYLINELKEKGDIENAMKIQRIFLESIVEDREIGKFNIDVHLDRRSKKAVSGAKIALTSAGKGRS